MESSRAEGGKKALSDKKKWHELLEIIETVEVISGVLGCEFKAELQLRYKIYNANMRKP